MKLTDHFQLSEFASKDGATTPLKVQHQLLELARNLEIIREAVNAPIHINSGYRSPAHNRAVGGASNSYHVRGMAADIVVRGKSPGQVFSVILDLMDDHIITPGGLHQYPTFVHYDIRGWRVLF